MVYVRYLVGIAFLCYLVVLALAFLWTVVLRPLMRSRMFRVRVALTSIDGEWLLAAVLLPAISAIGGVLARIGGNLFASGEPVGALIAGAGVGFIGVCGLLLADQVLTRRRIASTRHIPAAITKTLEELGVARTITRSRRDEIAEFARELRQRGSDEHASAERMTFRNYWNSHPSRRLGPLSLAAGGAVLLAFEAVVETPAFLVYLPILFVVVLITLLNYRATKWWAHAVGSELTDRAKELDTALQRIPVQPPRTLARLPQLVVTRDTGFGF